MRTRTRKNEDKLRESLDTFSISNSRILFSFTLQEYLMPFLRKKRKEFHCILLTSNSKMSAKIPKR